MSISNDRAVEILEKYPWTDKIEVLDNGDTYRIDLGPIDTAYIDWEFSLPQYREVDSAVHIENPIRVGIEITKGQTSYAIPGYNRTLSIRFYEIDEPNQKQLAAFHPHIKLIPDQRQFGAPRYYYPSCCALPEELYALMQRREIDLFMTVNFMYKMLTTWEYLPGALLRGTTIEELRGNVLEHISGPAVEAFLVEYHGTYL